MADVFISYSRRDDVFAKKLANALKKQERDVWIDWEDIPRAADWLNEIYAGIEGADTFILIVTQHSLSSEICAYEIAHARKHNKRMVPLIRQRIEGELETQVKDQWMDKTWEQTARDNWQQVGHLNWIFFEDDERFDAEFAVLTETLQTDIEHVKLHTRLLVRAREWEIGGNNPSFLLKGDEIDSADAWLEAADIENSMPEPTPLHRDYIQQSREREQAELSRLRNLRRATLIASVIGIIAIIATIIAGGASISASNQAAAAQIEADHALALAATATVAQGIALNLGATVEAGSTQLAADAAFFALQQERVGTLAAGAVVVPPGTSTPEPTQYVATLTQVAVMNAWEPIERTDESGVVMVQVPSGCFYMGSVAGGDEQPIHIQCFDEPFWIDKFEVTNSQFQSMVNDTPPSEFTDDLNPVDSIDWFDARDFCQLRGARLPNEREWEYAARGPDSLTYPWGNTYSPDVVVHGRPDDAGPLPVMDNSGLPLRPQGASWVGAIDMLGNVREWTSTRYDDVDSTDGLFNFQGLYPYPYRADDGRESDETFTEYDDRWEETSISTARVLRGGSYYSVDKNRPASYRGWDWPDNPVSNYGLRCASD